MKVTNELSEPLQGRIASNVVRQRVGLAPYGYVTPNECEYFAAAIVVSEKPRRTREPGRLEMTKQGVNGARTRSGRTADRIVNADNTSMRSTV